MKSRLRIEIWKSEVDKQWYWHFKRNGKIIAQGEGYKRKGKITKTLQNVMLAFKENNFTTTEIPQPKG